MLINLIKAFLTNRMQAVRIRDSLSDWMPLRGGIPQGTKLVVILFAVLTNNLLTDWHLGIKFVDDPTALEILPRNEISLLHMAANDIYTVAIEHRMRLNPKKCKEILIHFMHHHNFSLRTITIGNTSEEQVSSYKLLGITISNDLEWGPHVENIVKKASKRLYALRVLKKVNVPNAAIQSLLNNCKAYSRVRSAGVAKYTSMSVLQARGATKTSIIHHISSTQL